MDVALTPELEQFILEKVRSGRYASASDVLNAGLQLLKEQDARDQARFAALRDAIASGLEQADRGELAPLDSRATLARIRARRPAEDPGNG